MLPGVEHKAQLLADEDKSPLDIPDAGVRDRLTDAETARRAPGDSGCPGRSFFVRPHGWLGKFGRLAFEEKCMKHIMNMPAASRNLPLPREMRQQPPRSSRWPP